jgi:polysaccharide deacetylase 2 family uncharacterized protein YibQ
MGEDEFLGVLRQDLDRINPLLGVNNHMGSRLTEDSQRMGWLVEELAARGLGFLDSRTTPHSVGFELARARGLRAWKRDLFLDHVPRKEAIERELQALPQKAKKKRTLIAIGHPHPQTIEALAGRLPELRLKVRFVKLSDLSS